MFRYTSSINGADVSLQGAAGKAAKMLGDHTNYEKRVWYDTHNVTDLLVAGQNVLGFTVSGGWDTRRGTGKNGASVLVRLSIDLEDGKHVEVVSDTTWTSGAGPMTMSDIYQGETFNASRVTRGYDTPRFNGSGWVNVAVGGSPHNVTRHPWDRASLITTHAPLPQIEITGTVAPVDYWQAAPNSWTFDFGVNRAGVTTLRIPADVAAKLGRGATWKQQAAEALACAKPCGINHFPAQGADEILTYISDPALNSAAAAIPYKIATAAAAGGADANQGAATDDAAIDFTPRFTQFGFRYVILKL